MKSRLLALLAFVMMLAGGRAEAQIQPVTIPDKPLTGTLTANDSTPNNGCDAGACSEYVLEGTLNQMVTVTNVTGLSGTINLEYNALDGSNTWHPGACYNYGTFTGTNGGINAFGSTFTFDGTWACASIGGAKKIRVRRSAGSAGTMTVNWNGSSGVGGFLTSLATIGDIPDDVTDPNTVHPGGYPLFTGGLSHFTSQLSPVTFDGQRAPVSTSGDRRSFTTDAYGNQGVVEKNRCLAQTITANSQDRTFPLEGVRGFNVRISGTYNLTWAITFSRDGGDTYSLWFLYSTGLAQAVTGGSIANLSDDMKPIYADGMTHLRISSTAFTSGTMNIEFCGTSMPPSLFVAVSQGNLPHDAADSGNPVKTGGVATTSVSGITSVANADRVQYVADTSGRQIVMPVCNIEDIARGIDTDTDGSSTAVTNLGAVSASVRYAIGQITVSNSSASFATVDIRDGTGGTVLWTIPAPATSGATITFNPPLITSVNTAIAVDPSAGVSSLITSINACKTR